MQTPPHPHPPHTILLSRDARCVFFLSCAQGHGECSGYYMDYFKCIDKCASKVLFNELA